MLDDGTVLDVANVVWCTGFRPRLRLDRAADRRRGRLADPGAWRRCGGPGPVLRRSSVPAIRRVSPDRRRSLRRSRLVPYGAVRIARKHQCERAMRIAALADRCGLTHSRSHRGCRNRKPPSESVPRPDSTAAVQSSTSVGVPRSTAAARFSSPSSPSSSAASNSSPRTSGSSAPSLVANVASRRTVSASGSEASCRSRFAAAPGARSGQADCLPPPRECAPSELRSKPPHAIRGARATRGRPARRGQGGEAGIVEITRTPSRTAKRGRPAPSRVAAQRTRAPRLKIGRANAHPRRRAPGVSRRTPGKQAKGRQTDQEDVGRVPLGDAETPDREPCAEDLGGHRRPHGRAAATGGAPQKRTAPPLGSPSSLPPARPVPAPAPRRPRATPTSRCPPRPGMTRAPPRLPI